MKPVTISDARLRFFALGNRVAKKGERLVVTRRGKSRFALAPVEDIELLQRLEDPQDIRLARKTMKEPSIRETAKKELGL
ncbi:MAG: type II toxin-antitoxin system Phd/YefM family antitoxin [Phycisphaerae bacterium]|nr:type II toxin-antitoxin system Phd/YefM family antitoxin [Phycisphaerae bacterium]